MPRLSFRQFSLLTACASLTLTACGTSTRTSSDISTAKAASLETSATSTPSSSTAGSVVATTSASGSKRASKSSGDLPHYQKTVSIAPRASGDNLIIEVPFHVNVDVQEGNSLSVSYLVVAPKQKQLKGIKASAVSASKIQEGTKITIQSFDDTCQGIGISNGQLVNLQGLCLRSAQVTVPKGSEINVFKVDPDGMSQTPIWQGKVEPTGEALLAAIQPIFGDEDKVAMIKRFVRENRNAKVSVAELTAIADDIMMSEPQMEAIELLAPLVRRSSGRLKEKDIQPLVDEMFFDSEKEQVKKLLLK